MYMNVRSCVVHVHWVPKASRWRWCRVAPQLFLHRPRSASTADTGAGAALCLDVADAFLTRSSRVPDIHAYVDADWQLANDAVRSAVCQRLAADASCVERRGAAEVTDAAAAAVCGSERALSVSYDATIGCISFLSSNVIILNGVNDIGVLLDCYYSAGQGRARFNGGGGRGRRQALSTLIAATADSSTHGSAAAVSITSCR